MTKMILATRKGVTICKSGRNGDPRHNHQLRRLLHALAVSIKAATNTDGGVAMISTHPSTMGSRAPVPPRRWKEVILIYRRAKPPACPDRNQRFHTGPPGIGARRGSQKQNFRVSYGGRWSFQSGFSLFPDIWLRRLSSPQLFCRWKINISRWIVWSGRW